MFKTTPYLTTAHYFKVVVCITYLPQANIDPKQTAKEKPPEGGFKLPAIEVKFSIGFKVIYNDFELL